LERQNKKYDNQAIKMKKRVCKYCGVIYSTDKKYSKVCPECERKNHHEKVKRNLFNHIENQ
jgi:predicted Zn-ribbon and HTH transcriptional regulator